MRIGYAICGLAHLSLGIFSGSLALGIGGSSGSGNSATIRMLDSSWGRALIGIGMLPKANAMNFD